MDRAQITSHSPRWTIVICSLLLLCFTIISYSAVLTKNATIDEPTHDLSGWLAIRHDDFRLETVNPSLWKCWAALPNFWVDLKLLPEPQIWKDRTWNPGGEVPWASKMLYATLGVDGGAFINRSRAMMLVLGIMLGVLIARWSYQLGGSVAAVVATAMYSFDPNFIAHAPMIKSDVGFALVLLALAYSTWRLGQTASWRMTLAVGLICATAGNLKFSGIIVGPILALLLFVRVMLPQPWNSFGRLLNGRSTRFLAATAIGLFAVVCCYVITWASYGFRYRPAPSPAVRMDMPAIYARARLVETTAELMRAPTDQELAAHVPGLTVRFVQWADRFHVLPQAMLAGFLYQSTCVQLWPAFLNGELYGNGRWYYFPLATIYKTPVSELTAYGLMVIVLITAVIFKCRARFWTVICLVIPAGVFTAAALTTHLNIGFRNFLPAFPFMQIAVGCAAAFCWKRRPRVTAATLAVLGFALMVETLTAWPDYIAYFNFPTGGELGGKTHLGDSNLDWGQDLIGLAKWKREHKDIPLYAKLEYAVDPRFYGLDYHEIGVVPDGPHAGELLSDVPLRRGAIAVSATQLQGLYVKRWEANFYDKLRAEQPIAIINGTIYIYEFRPPN